MTGIVELLIAAAVGFALRYWNVIPVGPKPTPTPGPIPVAPKPAADPPADPLVDEAWRRFEDHLRAAMQQAIDGVLKNVLINPKPPA